MHIGEWRKKQIVTWGQEAAGADGYVVVTRFNEHPLLKMHKQGSVGVFFTVEKR